MRNQEASERFQLTKKLFEEGRYAEALDILVALDEAYPGTKNIIYPRALCLTRLGRTDEAIELCDQLITKFSDHRARLLLAELTEPAASAQIPEPAFQPVVTPPQVPGHLPGLEALDQGQAVAPGAQAAAAPGIPQIQDVSDLFAAEGQAVVPPPPRGGSSGWLVYVALAALVVLVLGGVAASFWWHKGADSAGGAAPPAHQVAELGVEVAPPDATTVPEPAAQAPPSASEGLAWYDDYSQGIEAHVARRAPTLLFFTDPSTETARMEQQVFEEPSIVQLLDGWVLIRVDGSAQPAACAEHGITSFPSTVILNSLGIPVYSESGALTARALYDTLVELDVKPPKAQRFKGLFISLVIVVSLISLVNFPLYFTLRLTGNLPYDTFSQNILSVIGMTIVLALCNAIPVIGFFVAIYVLTKRYDMGLVDWLIYIVFQVVYTLVTAFVAAAIFGVSLLEAFG